MDAAASQRPQGPIGFSAYWGGGAGGWKWPRLYSARSGSMVTSYKKVLGLPWRKSLSNSWWEVDPIFRLKIE